MSLPTTSFAVLGLLSMAPASGYEVAQRADLSIANFWPISKSQVYGELQRLENLGQVRGTDVAQDKVPDKRVYELTTSGAEQLDAWLSEPTYEPNRGRVAFLVKVFFAHRMPRDRFRKLLERYRSEAERERAYLQQIVDELDAPQAWFTRATALYGLRNAEATIAWADEVTATMPRRVRIPKDAAERTKQIFDRIPERGKGR